MKYETFKERLVSDLTKMLDNIGSLQLRINKVTKVNQSLDGISVINEKSRTMAGPTLYVQDLYDYYTHATNGNFDDVVDKAIALIMRWLRLMPDCIELTDVSLETMPIIPQVINVEKNKELLDTVPHRMIDGLDLAIIYRFIVDIDNENGFHSTIITHELAEEVDKSEEELYEKAKLTVEELFPCDISCFEGQLCIVSNNHQKLGAMYAFDVNVLNSIAEMLDEEKLYIIPSSLHECFVIPAISQDVEGLKKTITDTNRNFVSDEDFLSDNPYLYLKKENKIVIA